MRHKLAYRIAPGDGAPEMLLKVSDEARLRPWRRLGASRARRGLACAERLAASGGAALLPIAVGERRRGALRSQSYELLPWISDSVDLAHELAEPRGHACDRRAWQGELGALVRALHEAGVDQDDLAPNNFLWCPGAHPAVLAIDFERARRRRGRVPARRRLEALAKLGRHAARAPATSRMRVLRAYCAGDRDAARRLWRALEAASARLWRRDVRRWTRIARRGGRRFEVLAGIGLVRCGVPVDAVRAAFAATARGAWQIAVCDAPNARAARRLFGVALALHQRGLAPRPDAFVVDGAHVRIAYAWAPEATQVDAGTARAARVVAIDRLLALAGLDPTRLARAFAFGDGSAWLLDPSALRLAEPPIGAGRRAVARRLAASAQSL